MSSIFPAIYMVGAVVVALTSWIGAIYGYNVRSVLSTDGIKWMVVNFMDNITLSQLSTILFILIAVGVCSESGLLKSINGDRSLKQKYALRFTSAILIVYFIFLLLLILTPPYVLLNAFGTFNNSPLSKGALGLSLFAMILAGNVFGYLSGRFAIYSDFIDAHCILLRKCAPLFITIIIASQLMALIVYVFKDISHMLIQLLSFILYYLPLLIYIVKK